MEQLIPIASKLQDVLGAVGQTTSLDLPQIVVVGGQSSGKSSVLESIVGRSFLPRGTGIVTRRPLILQLYNTRQGTLTISTSSSTGVADGTASAIEFDTKGVVDVNGIVSGDEWGEFLHKPEKKFYDFGAIRREINNETDRTTGRNRGVDHEPIHLKIYSPRVLALTLVDLPGIAKVPVGDQPFDIEKQIRDMCLHYISNPNAIILAVTSANTDLANSDALQLAQMADPSGNRTVGVLTKIDLMDPGTDCSDILMNRVIPLRRGYIAVVNRGQIDIASDSSIRDGLKKEEQFFKKHPVYSKDRSLLSKCGTPRLSKALNTMLMHHIRDCLPDLKARISHMISDVNQELEALGSAAHNASRSTRGAALLKLLSKFATNFGSLIDGKGCKDLEKSKRVANGGTGGSNAYHTIATTELEGGARISYVFTDVFAASLSTVGAFDSLTDDEVRTTIRNANGTRPALFVPEISFDILVRKQIARLEQPGIECVDLVYEELQRIASQSEPNELTRFPVLRDRMTEVVHALLRRCLGPTQMMIANLVKIELAYINTSHPDFIGGSQAVARLMDKIGKNQKMRKQVAQTVGSINAAVTSSRPLATSALNNSSSPYGFEDANENEVPVSDSDEVESSGGIMNFIFRGADQPKKSSVQPYKPTSGGGGGGGVPSEVHLPQVPDTMIPSDVPSTDREAVEMEVIKSLIDSYFAIVRKNFIDMVPKTIMYFLVNHVRDSLQNELVSELYRDAEMGVLLQEAEDIAVRRQTCNEMKSLLGKALEIVNEVRDFNSFK